MSECIPVLITRYYYRRASSFGVLLYFFLSEEFLCFLVSAWSLLSLMPSLCFFYVGG